MPAPSERRPRPLRPPSGDRAGAASLQRRSRCQCGCRLPAVFRLRPDAVFYSRDEAQPRVRGMVRNSPPPGTEEDDGESLKGESRHQEDEGALSCVLRTVCGVVHREGFGHLVAVLGDYADRDRRVWPRFERDTGATAHVLCSVVVDGTFQRLLQAG